MFLCDETFNVYITLKVHFVSFVMIIIIQQQQQPPQQQQQQQNNNIYLSICITYASSLT